MLLEYLHLIGSRDLTDGLPIVTNLYEGPQRIVVVIGHSIDSHRGALCHRLVKEITVVLGSRGLNRSQGMDEIE